MSLKGGAYRADPIPPPEQARTLSVPKLPPPSPRGPLSWAPMISPGIFAVDEDAFQRVQVPSPRAVALLGGLPGEGGPCAPRRCLVRLRGSGGNRTRSRALSGRWGALAWAGALRLVGEPQRLHALRPEWGASAPHDGSVDLRLRGGQLPGQRGVHARARAPARFRGVRTDGPAYRGRGSVRQFVEAQRDSVTPPLT